MDIVEKSRKTLCFLKVYLAGPFFSQICDFRFMFNGKCISFFVFMSRLVVIAVFAYVSLMVCISNDKYCVVF